MCVIMASETKRPTEVQLEAGWKQNPWGAGVAWQEKDKKGKIWMRWEKGITELKDLIKHLKSIPDGPAVIHLRIPTEGLDDVALTHPFPVTNEAQIDFSGKTDVPLLFHNGGWAQWRPFSLDTALKSGIKLPEGLLNDSRMMAWNTSIFGSGILQLINEKVILFGPKGLDFYGTDKANGWELENDIWFSNDLWRKHLPKIVTPTPLRQVHGRTHETTSTTTNGGPGGDRPAGTFRTDREPGARGEDLDFGRPFESHKVEGRQEDIRSYPEQGGEESGQRNDPSLIKDRELRELYRHLHGVDPPYLALRRRIGFSTPATMLTM